MFYQFGIGGMFGKPRGGNLATPSTPVQFGTIQNCDVEFAGKNVALMGQNKLPDDVAPGDEKITFKAGFAQIDIDIYNSLYFGDVTTPGGTQVARGEFHAAVSGVTVLNAGTFVEDLGVLDVTDPDANAKLLIAGVDYTVTGGNYSFTNGPLDVKIAYSFTVTTGKTLLVKNHPQGYGPTFSLYFSMHYQGESNLYLFKCRAAKMGAPMKRDGYMISDFEGEAYQDAAGNVFRWYQV